eukprot:COSAG02_NODE_3548_length_6580_cov_2104.438358_2_plen_171_part_00
MLHLAPIKSEQNTMAATKTAKQLVPPLASSGRSGTLAISRRKKRNLQQCDWRITKDKPHASRSISRQRRAYHRRREFMIAHFESRPPLRIQAPQSNNEKKVAGHPWLSRSYASPSAQNRMGSKPGLSCAKTTLPAQRENDLCAAAGHSASLAHNTVYRSTVQPSCCVTFP